MALTQTRRSISVRGVTYDTLRRYSNQHDRSMSDIVEELLAGLLGRAKPQRSARTIAPHVVRAPVVKAPAKAAPMVKPAPAKARPVPAKTVKPAAPTAKGTAGRPAPTSAAVALSNTRRPSSGAGKSDYRVIRF